MKLTKRLLAALLAAALLILAVPVLAASAEGDVTVLTLDAETFKRNSDKIGVFEDGRLEFRKNENIRGNLTLQNPVDITAGNYVLRAYLRSPQKIAGAFEFLKFNVKQSNKTLGEQAMTGNSFTAYQNKSIICAVPFTAADGKVDITVSYQGNFNILIDRIEIAPADAASASQAIEKEGIVAGAVTSYVFEAADLEKASVIDTFAITYGDTTAYIPVSYLQAWFDTGYTKATMVFDAADVALKNRLVAKMNSYNASNYLVTSFDFLVVLTDGEGNDTVLENMPSTVTIETLVPQRITSKFKASERKLGICYQNSANSSRDNGAIGTLSKNADGKVVITGSLNDLGTFLIAAACLK